MMSMVVVSDSFDDLRAAHIRVLHEASKQGPLKVEVWSDELVKSKNGHAPKFPQEERLYFVRGIRFVKDAEIVNQVSENAISADLSDPTITRIPVSSVAEIRPSDQKKVLVTGCYDWLHSGHVRFFEEASAFGDLYVVVGHDANIALLKGAGHPQFSQEERRYMVGSLKSVHQSIISTGEGWMDAAPEVARIKPDIYAVNEDGDRPEKRSFCQANNIEYLVMKRLPKEGLPARSSTALRGHASHAS